MMPPFAGQGLNSGIRDALNLAWKLHAVLRGRAGDGLLDSYEVERRPHAEAIIRLSVRLGGIMMTTSQAKAKLRDASIATGALLPAIRRFLTEMRYKPAPAYKEGLIVKDPAHDDLAGRMLPQPRVLLAEGGQALLDEALGPWFSLVAVDPSRDVFAELRSEFWEELGASRVELKLGDRLPTQLTSASSVADADGLLEPVLGDQRGRLLLLRPDRFILGVFDPAEEDVFVARIRDALGSGGARPRFGGGGVIVGDVRLTLAVGNFDHVRDLTSGAVVPKGIDLTCLVFERVEEIFFRFLNFQEWEVSEVSFGAYVARISQGHEDLVAIPVFPARSFRQSALYVRRDGSVNTPEDLAGKRVGVPAWSQTAGIYARGWLMHQHGLRLQDVEWFQAGLDQPGRTEPVEVDLPQGVTVMNLPDRTLDEMLLNGGIDAIISARPSAQLRAPAPGRPKVDRGLH